MANLFSDMTIKHIFIVDPVVGHSVFVNLSEMGPCVYIFIKNREFYIVTLVGSVMVRHRKRVIVNSISST